MADEKGTEKKEETTPTNEGAQTDTQSSQAQPTQEQPTAQPQNPYALVLEELAAIRAENAAMKSQLNAMQGSRAITIERGAIIQDESEPTAMDGMKPYGELDFTLA